MVVLCQNGDTLLHWAIQGRQPLEGIVLELLNCGADPNIPDRVRFPFVSLCVCVSVCARARVRACVYSVARIRWTAT